MPIRALVRALRPKQWLKNGLLFAALVFSRNTFNLPMVQQVALGFLVFSVLSSCGYLYNDLKDIEADRLHPTKKNRPLASGELPVGVAVVFMGVGSVAALAGAWLLNPLFFAVSLTYLISTLLYTAVLKHIVILDVMSLATGFLLRAVAGAVVISVPISQWFLLCTALGALFIGISKRYSEMMLLEGEAHHHRKNLQEYSPELLKQMLNVTASGTLMSYALYTVNNTHGPWMMITLPFVLYGIFRYQYLVTIKGEGGAPEQTLLRDRPLQATVVLLVVTAILALSVG